MKNMKEGVRYIIRSLRIMPIWQLMGRGLAAIIIILLLLQLFSFDEMPNILAQLGISGAWGVVLSISLVVAELLTLPFLLDMKVSSAVLRGSEAASIIAVVLLIVIGVTGILGSESVLFGAYTRRVPMIVQVVTIISTGAIYGYYKYMYNKSAIKKDRS